MEMQMNTEKSKKRRGAVTRPAADVMSFFGILKSRIKYDPHEKRKARAAIGRRAARRH
jgi:hypothetical protein